MSSTREAFVAGGFVLPQRMPALRPAREFLTSAGFGGAAALLAALVIVLVAVFALRQASKRSRLQLEQQQRHHEELRADERRAAQIKECRERLAWVVDKGTLEPAASEDATVGFGPQLALTVLDGLRRDAEQLDDATLATAAAVQLNQFSLVLAQQGSALSDFAPDNASATNRVVDEQPAPPASPDPPPPSIAETPNPPARKAATPGRRHRQ